MKDEWLKYCDLWYQMLQRVKKTKTGKFLWTYSIDEMVVNVRQSRCFLCVVFWLSSWQSLLHGCSPRGRFLNALRADKIKYEKLWCVALLSGLPCLGLEITASILLSCFDQSLHCLGLASVSRVFCIGLVKMPRLHHWFRPTDDFIKIFLQYFLQIFSAHAPLI